MTVTTQQSVLINELTTFKALINKDQMCGIESMREDLDARRRVMLCTLAKDSDVLCAAAVQDFRSGELIFNCMNDYIDDLQLLLSLAKRCSHRMMSTLCSSTDDETIQERIVEQWSTSMGPSDSDQPEDAA